MSLRELVDPECGGANPLMRLGGHMIQDAARKDDGIAGPSGSSTFSNRTGQFDEHQLVNEFLGQIAPAPQTFRMDALLKEMREIDNHNFPAQVVCAPPVIEEVNNGSGVSWASEFAQRTGPMAGQQENADESALREMGEQFWNKAQPQPDFAGAAVGVIPFAKQDSITLTSEFFDSIEQETAIQKAAGTLHRSSVTADPEQFKYSEFMKFMNNVGDGEVQIDNGQVKNNMSIWADEFSFLDHKLTAGVNEVDWVKDFAESKETQEKTQEKFNSQFWNRLQDEWKKISEENEEQHPWLSEFSEYYDPYKEYTFDEDNPMMNTENAFEKGKEFLALGDIPSAVLCFEAAVHNDMENAEIWELLGTSQAENEKDPNAIAALKESLEFNPNNPNVFMALAISYTNESLQSQALKMLIEWLRCNTKYQHIVPESFHNTSSEAEMASSLVQDLDLREVQNLYLQAVQQSPNVIDPEIQEALGVLFNLSSEYNKAVDCFKAALHAKPNSAKVWNRLGASLANGNRSVEAVDAYQHALDIEPGYIRARYNVGIICINLKAYKEAIEHFLTALNHQATSMARSGMNNMNANNQMSDTIWSTLRMAVSLLGMTELQAAIDQKDLQALNVAFRTNE